MERWLGKVGAEGLVRRIYEVRRWKEVEEEISQENDGLII